MTKEHHEDGSTTERFSNGQSVTRDEDGSVRESTHHEFTVSNTLGVGDKITVTKDGEGHTTNIQSGWGDKK